MARKPMINNRETAAAVMAWATGTEKRMTALFRQSSQDMSIEVSRPKGSGGNMPVITGNLRRSKRASTSEPIQLDKLDGKRRNYSDNEGNVTSVIANLQLGDTLYIGFQAGYAPFAEAKNGFLRLAIQKWSQIVQRAARSLKSRVDARKG